MAICTRLAAAWAWTGWTGASAASMADLRYGVWGLRNFLRNAARPPGRQQRARLAHQKVGDRPHELRTVEPRPMARTLRDFDLRGAAQRVGIGLREVGRDVRIVGAPHDERGARQPAQALARARELVLVGAAIQPQDRPLRA